MATWRSRPLAELTDLEVDLARLLTPTGRHHVTGRWTTMCWTFLSVRGCIKGDQCSYAHSSNVDSSNFNELLLMVLTCLGGYPRGSRPLDETAIRERVQELRQHTEPRMDELLQAAVEERGIGHVPERVRAHYLRLHGEPEEGDESDEGETHMQIRIVNDMALTQGDHFGDEDADMMPYDDDQVGSQGSGREEDELGELSNGHASVSRSYLWPGWACKVQKPPIPPPSDDVLSFSSALMTHDCPGRIRAFTGLHAAEGGLERQLSKLATSQCQGKGGYVASLLSGIPPNAPHTFSFSVMPSTASRASVTSNGSALAQAPQPGMQSVETADWRPRNSPSPRKYGNRRSRSPSPRQYSNTNTNNRPRRSRSRSPRTGPVVEGRRPYHASSERNQRRKGSPGRGRSRSPRQRRGERSRSRSQRRPRSRSRSRSRGRRQAPNGEGRAASGRQADHAEGRGADKRWGNPEGASNKEPKPSTTASGFGSHDRAGTAIQDGNRDTARLPSRRTDTGNESDRTQPSYKSHTEPHRESGVSEKRTVL